MRRLGSTLALLAAAAAIAAAPASGATTRAEYAAQANAICAVSLPQYEEAGRDLDRYARKVAKKNPAKIRPKHGKRLIRKLTRALRTVNEIARNENLQLATLVAAPGDESVVAAWLTSRDELVRLGDDTVDQFRELRRLLSGRPKFKDIFKLLTVAGEMERTAKQLEARAEEADLYGGQLGATTCASDAPSFSSVQPGLVPGFAANLGGR